MTPTELDAEWRAAWRARMDAAESELDAKWRDRLDVIKSALRATGLNKETHIEQLQRADYNAAQGYVARGCCCTINHTQVITDYQSQEHTP